MAIKLEGRRGVRKKLFFAASLRTPKIFAFELFIHRFTNLKAKFEAFPVNRKKKTDHQFRGHVNNLAQKLKKSIFRFYYCTAD